MKPRPTIDLDRDAQIVALWKGRPSERRGPADVEAFCQWLADYVPWLVPAGVDWREQIRTLIHSLRLQGDDWPDDRQPARVPKRR